jgi:hypothetical protein
MIAIESISESEIQTALMLEDRLGQLDALAAKAFDLIATILAMPDPRPINKTPLAKSVQINLLVRLSNDLRTVSMLARIGYGIQTATIASALQEIAWMSLHIGIDEERAKEWVNHKTDRRSYGSQNLLAKLVLQERYPLNYEDSLKREVEVYETLCKFKHGNPQFQKFFGTNGNEEYVTIRNGPESSENSIRCCFYSMHQSIRLILLVSENYSRLYFAQDLAISFKTLARSIHSDYKKLIIRENEIQHEYAFGHKIGIPDV